MQKVLKELFDQFVKTNGREPDNLEMILIRQKASAEDIRKRKIISMFDRSPVDADKPILGGQNIEETDTQILERLNKGNEEGINRLKNKKDKPDDMATGGRAGYVEGGPIHPRLGELSSGVSSAEEQLQQINQSLKTAETNLGESGPGGAGSVTPSVNGYESSGSSLYNESPAGEVNNPYQAPVGMDPIKMDLIKSPMPYVPDTPSGFSEPLQKTVDPGNNPYDYGGGLGGLLGEGGSSGSNTDPYNNTMLSGLSQDGQRFDSSQNAFDALVEQTKKYRESSPYSRDVIGSELYQGEEGFKNFTKNFDKINNPSYTAPQLQGQLQSSGGGLGGSLVNKQNPYAPPNRVNDMMQNDPRFQVNGGLRDSPIQNPQPQQPEVTGIMSGYQDFANKTYGDKANNFISTADTREYTLPDGTTGSGSSTSIGRINDYLKSIGQPGVTFNNNFNAGLLQGFAPGVDPMGSRKENPTGPLQQLAQGGRAGYYMGGQAMVGEDLSDIGHGSDSLMARNMQVAPGSQATTSTGLNYLLGQDNDTARVPYKDAGPVVLPKKKPNSDFKSLLKIYNTYKDSMPGVSEDTQKYLAQDFINKLNEKGLSQTQFQTLRMQNHYEESKADGGRIEFGGGGSMGASDKGYQGGGRDTKGSVSGTAPGAAPSGGGGSDDRSSPEQKINHFIAMNNAQQPKTSKLKNMYNTGSEINYLKNIYKMDPIGLGISYGIKRYGPGIMEKLKGLRSEAELEEDQNGIMQMAELSQKQLNFLNSKKTKRDLTDRFLSPQQVYDKLPEYEEKTPLNPFKGDQEPTTPKEFNEYLDTIDTNKFLERITVAEGGPARQNFKMGKRAFLKLMGGVGAGIASLKTGLLDFTKGGGKKVAKEVVKEATGGPPAYFFKLVDKIRKLGDDAPKLAVKDKENVTTYKDYTLTEDITTGEQTIQRMKIDDDLKYDASEYYGKPVGEEVYMSYRPGKGLADETTKGKTPPDEYTEDTSLIRSDKPAEGEVMETVSGVPDDIFLEVGEEIPEIIRKEKADGGRIGYAGGKKVVDAIIKKVNKKSGKKAVTTADKAEIPKETLLRDMFTDTNKRLNKKREMTADEYDDFVEEVGGADQLEAYNFDGTVGDAERILKEQDDRMAYMYDQYRTGKLDPVAGDKSPARKRFLEQKLADMEASGDKRLMTREEIEELSSFDLGTQMDQMKDIDISQGMIDLDEMNFTKNAQAAKNKMDNMDVNQKIKEGVASIMSDTSPAALEKSIEIDNLMLKYPGMDNALAEQIATSEPIKKADLIAMVEQTFKLSEQGKSGSEIIDIFKKTPRTKQATGGLASMLGK